LKTGWTRLANFSEAGTVGVEVIRLPASVSEDVEATVTVEVHRDEIGQIGSESSTVQEEAKNDEATVSSSSADAVVTETEAEADSPLDNSKFLSFEEWKKQNLEKAGQASDAAGKARRIAENRRQMNLENSMDTFGDDGEIDLAFFGGGGSEDQPLGWTSGQEQKPTVTDDNAALTARSSRKKDAGTTCKERFNYASLDCAATILKYNAKCKSPSSILVENKDSYMLNECSIDNKFLIVELCDNILIDTVVLANFEFFSSMFRTFRVSISDRYPVKADRWKELGIFTATNSRDVQAFAVENPLIWAKYLRVEFLTHYGSEYYCPVSLLRVHGTTMIEDLKAQDEPLKEEEEEQEVEVVAALEPEPQAEGKIAELATPTIVAESSPQAVVAESPQELNASAAVVEAPQSPQAIEQETTTSLNSMGVNTSNPETETSKTVQAHDQESPKESKSTTVISSISDGQETHTQISLTSPTSTSSSDKPVSQGPEPSPTSPSQIVSPPSKASPQDSDTKSIPQSSSQSQSEIKTGQPVSDVQRPSSSVSQPPAPSPTTQESFFKSITKRLQILESNATLSLQYIEEQSRILRDAFTKVEKRQLSKTEEFLRHLNNTVMTELKTFRQQYDQLWQSTVIELETHREQYQREILAVSTRLTILADELVWQKRMAVVQSTLLLLCLFLVIFGRAGATHLELPIMNQVLNKSYSRLSSFPLDSAPGSPSSKDSASSPRASRALVRERSERRSSDEVHADLESRSPSPSPRPPPIDDVSPAATPSEKKENNNTPTPLGERIRALRRADGGVRTRSGPATPRGTRDVPDQMQWNESPTLVGEENDENAVNGMPKEEREKERMLLAVEAVIGGLSGNRIGNEPRNVHEGAREESRSRSGSEKG
jgi:Sad1 / UNC-like C-terminal